MYAVIGTGGKQYRVNVGDIVFVEKLGIEVDQEVKFDNVIIVGDGETMKIGSPTVEGASVTAKVLRNARGKKITVFTYRAKKDSKRKLGHRQSYSKIEITAINA